jgi:hypothetical protein
MSNPLLLEIQLFAVGKSAYHQNEPPESKITELNLPVKVSSNFMFFSNSTFSEEKSEATRGTSSASRCYLRLLLYYIRLLDRNLR